MHRENEDLAGFSGRLPITTLSHTNIATEHTEKAQSSQRNFHRRDRKARKVFSYMFFFAFSACFAVNTVGAF